MNSCTRFTILLLIGCTTLFTRCSNNSTNSEAHSKEMQSKIDSMQIVLRNIDAGNSTLAKNLMTFDTLDFTVFSNQEWIRLHESHSKDITVYLPDGHHTDGIERHIEDLKALFVYAPDTKIKQHPIKIGNNTGEWTCVMGFMEGTFSKPMPNGNGQFIQATGKSFKFPMCTIGHWKNGLMIEEWLFWDNQTFHTQIGLIK